MRKRFYLFVSLFAALSLSVALGSVFAAQKEKAKEKTRAPEAQSKAESETPQVYTMSGFAGSGSYLGVYLEEVTAERAKELRLSEERGAIVSRVVEGSPAEKAGLKENDCIVSFNDRRIDSVGELQRLLSETPAGRNVKLEVVRGGSRQTITAAMSKRASSFAYAFNAPEWKGQAWAQTEEGRKQLEENRKQMDAWRKQYQDQLRQHQDEFRYLPNFGDFNLDYNVDSSGRFVFFSGSRLGIGAESLTNQLAEFFGVKDGHGVLVASVKEESPAARGGLKAGDVIIAVNDQKIESVNSLVTALAGKEGNVTLKIIRNHAEQTVNVTLEKRDTPPPVRRVTTSRPVRSV
ncbi:MAG TPA: PDZ domain-containing protein [Blastocatellia bacterium]|nr:PDZ domain-containing protein [Blastocatellia bacterium]